MSSLLNSNFQNPKNALAGSCDKFHKPGVLGSAGFLGPGAGPYDISLSQRPAGFPSSGPWISWAVLTRLLFYVIIQVSILKGVGMAINNKIPKGSIKEWIVKVKTQNPEYTLQAVGNVCGVTREYVRQVLNSNGIETTKRLKPLPRCVTCNSEFSRNRAITHTECSACVKAFKRTTTVCPNCGTEKETLKSHIRRNKNTFCNNYCQFSYWGKTYGFKAAQTYAEKETAFRGDLPRTRSEWQDYNHITRRPTTEQHKQFTFKQ